MLFIKKNGLKHQTRFNFSGKFASTSSKNIENRFSVENTFRLTYPPPLALPYVHYNANFRKIAINISQMIKMSLAYYYFGMVLFTLLSSIKMCNYLPEMYNFNI